jgi:hypothetical protein
MHVKRRRLSNFEAGSVALFASLALGGAALPARAQTVAPTTSSSPSTLRESSAGSIPPNRWTSEQLAQAFKRTDTNGDGQISRQEAALLPGLARRFDQLDTNKDGSISSAEFDEALK